MLYKKIEFIGAHPVNSLDVSVLRKEIITGILASTLLGTLVMLGIIFLACN